MKRDLPQLHAGETRGEQMPSCRKGHPDSKKALCLGAGSVAAMVALLARGARPALRAIEDRLDRTSFLQGDDKRLD